MAEENERKTAYVFSMYSVQYTSVIYTMRMLHWERSKSKSKNKRKVVAAIID